MHFVDKRIDNEKLTEEWESFYEKLVPRLGRSDTVEGEMMRAVSKICCRFYNDGDLVYEGYGRETAGPAFLYLLSKADKIPQINDFARNVELCDYQEELFRLIRCVLDYVKSRDTYEKNEECMFDYKSTEKMNFFFGVEEEEEDEEEWEDGEYK